MLENVFHSEHEDRHIFSCFLGMMLLTVLYACLSLFRVGSIFNIKIIDMVLFVLLCIWFMRSRGREGCKRRLNGCLRFSVSKPVYLKLMGVMSFLMIAVGRANNSLDYDSVWYGLRSPYVLNNKTGIYDNLKLVGCVYTYPKGYEVYQLPLSGFDSYGFVYAGNIIMSLAVLYMVYKICKLFVSAEYAVWGALLASAIPGIMNMSVTAKPDIMTLLIQLFIIYSAILLLRKKDSAYAVIILSGYIYTQTLKSSSVIFSTTILLAVIFICFIYKIKPCKSHSARGFLLLSVTDLVLIWYRTYLLTGIPATSIWGGLFRKFGMTDKYPYKSGQISQFRMGSLFDREVLSAVFTRIKEVLFAPNSTDTDHIVIAWGTTLCTFLIFFIVLGIIFSFRKTFFELKKHADLCFIILLAIGEFAGCLLSLWVGTKPDGNYFMLYYSATIICATVYARILISDKTFSKNILTGLVIFFLPLNIIFSGAANWAWCSAFSKIEWLNKGYYDHRQEFKDWMNQAGCDQIYDIMSKDPSNRVLAFGVHPSVERVPCVIESELDVTNWGNWELVASVDNFVRFVNFAEYDYIYIAPGYVVKDNSAYDNLCGLFEKDMITSVMKENDHILFTLGENEDHEQSIRMKEQFAEAI